MKNLECMNCYNSFDQESSDAKVSSLYCSTACEDESDATLAEGNKIVADYVEHQSSVIAAYTTGAPNIADALASAQYKVKIPTAVPLRPQGDLNKILDGLKTKEE